VGRWGKARDSEERAGTRRDVFSNHKTGTDEKNTNQQRKNKKNNPPFLPPPPPPTPPSERVGRQVGAFDPALTAPIYNFVRGRRYCSAPCSRRRGRLVEEPADSMLPTRRITRRHDYCLSSARARARGLCNALRDAIVHVEGGTAGLDVRHRHEGYPGAQPRALSTLAERLLETLPSVRPRPFDSLDLSSYTRRSATAQPR